MASAPTCPCNLKPWSSGPRSRNQDQSHPATPEFTIGGVNYNEFVNDGKVTRTIANLGAGVYSIMVNYSGDMRFNSTSRLTTFVVKLRRISCL